MNYNEEIDSDQCLHVGLHSMPLRSFICKTNRHCVRNVLWYF